MAIRLEAISIGLEAIASKNIYIYIYIYIKACESLGTQLEWMQFTPSVPLLPQVHRQSRPCSQEWIGAVLFVPFSHLQKDRSALFAFLAASSGTKACTHRKSGRQAGSQTAPELVKLSLNMFFL